MDTWDHVRGLSEASSSKNLEFNYKMTILHELNQFRMVVWNQLFNSSNYNSLEHFAWLCEIFAWSCEINLTILICLRHNSTFWSILHSHAKWKYLIFKLSFVIFSISSFWIHLNYLQISSKSRSKYIASSLSSILFALLNFISLLSLNASKITLKSLQNFTKIISISCKGNNVLLGHIRHNYYSKGMQFMRIII